MLALVAVLLMITTISCSENSTGPDLTEGFTGEWAVVKWSQSGIEEGTTSMNGTAEEISMDYNVDLGNPGTGVSRRTAIFSVTVPESGTVEFDWLYTGFHSFFKSVAELYVISGSESNELINAKPSSFEFTGSTSIEVVEGETLEIEVGGKNSDSNSRLRGEVNITNFRVIPSPSSP